MRIVPEKYNGEVSQNQVIICDDTPEAFPTSWENNIMGQEHIMTYATL